MTLQNRILYMASATIILVALTILVSSYLVLQASKQRFEDTIIKAETLLWTKIVDTELSNMEAESSSLLRDRELKKKLRSKDYARIVDTVQTSYRRLTASKVLTGLAITDDNYNIIFSEPNTSNSFISKPLVIQAQSTGKMTKGLVTGLNKLTELAVAFPISGRGKTLGIGVFTKFLSNALKQLKKSVGAEAAVMSKNGKLELTTNPVFFSELNLEKPELAREYRKANLKDKIYAITFTAIRSVDNKIISYLVTATDYTESYNKQSDITTFSAFIAISLTIAILVVCHIYIKTIFKPLNSAVKSMQQIAAGTLTIQITHADQEGEVGLLMQALSSMVKQLHSVISDVRTMSKNIESSTKDMEKIANETSTGVNKQLSDTEQVAQAMEQMSETINDIASSAETASNAATTASIDANSAQSEVNDSTLLIHSTEENIHLSAKQVNDLSLSSNNINSVLDVIKGIAEQTNLLALNAAIEAARAGAQGRGFAVVADEVRTLAQRTQKSTENINEMLKQLKIGTTKVVRNMEGISENVDSNVKQSEKVKHSLDTVTHSISDIVEMNLKIATAVEQQARTCKEISASVSNIRKQSNQSADGATQARNHSLELRKQAIELNNLVAHFRT